MRDSPENTPRSAPAAFERRRTPGT
jgi:hypothetical protein